MSVRGKKGRIILVYLKIVIGEIENPSISISYLGQTAQHSGAA